MKRIWSLFAVLALLCALTIPALAAASGAADAEPAAQTVSEEELARSEENTTKVRKIWAVAALIGVACFGGALGMAHSVAKAANNMAEQPEAAGQIVCPPELGFLFPAFTDRSGDLNHINIYGITEKKREELGRLISL